MKKQKILILTDSTHPNLYPDEVNLLSAFKRHGVEAMPVVWDQYQFVGPNLILIRTPWDYAKKQSQFLDLLKKNQELGGQCLNPLSTIMWNIDKRYMLELESKINVIPTQVSDEFCRADIDLAQKKWGQLVIKPLVGAGGRDTFLIKELADNSKADVLLGQAVMLQPFVESILSDGEYSFIYFDGQFSHAVVKNAKPGEFRVQDDHGGRVNAYQPNKDDLDQINHIVKHIDHACLYVRVDVVYYQNKWTVMEIEAIEPELFFRFKSGSEDLFCHSVKKAFLL
jgi:glutathione synthase/RimK-type ligase-like ATP-grasp enzyme